MEDPKIAAKEPIAVEVEAGKKYFFWKDLSSWTGLDKSFCPDLDYLGLKAAHFGSPWLRLTWI